MLGQANEREAELSRSIKDEAARAREVKHFTDEAANAYSRILTRYPVMGRAKDARARLEALHRPVPKATPEAIAQNKQEEESRREAGHFSRLMVNFRRRPDVSQSAKVGEPTLVPPRETSATEVAVQAQRALAPGPSTVTVQAGPAGAAPPPNQPVPRSPGGDNSALATGNAGDALPELKPVGEAALPASQAPQAPPAQLNEAAGDSQSSASTADSSQQASSSSSSATGGSSDAQSSSKGRKKKKKKLWPF